MTVQSGQTSLKGMATPTGILKHAYGTGLRWHVNAGSFLLSDKYQIGSKLCVPE